MAHTCPDCGKYCTCQGDWDDIDMGIWTGCECDCCEEESDDEEDYDDYIERTNPNDSRNL